MIRSRLMGVVAVLALSVGMAAQADWPRFMGADNDGIAKNEKLAASWPEGGPKVLWTVPTGSGFGGPAIADGKVYLLDRVGNEKDKFRVLDLKDGSEVWSHEYDTQPYKGSYGGSRGTPTVNGDMVYTVGVMGDVHAFDVKGKKVAWSKKLQDFGARPGGWGFAQSPLVLGDSLILATPGSKESSAVALDKKTGEVKWKAEAYGNNDAYTSPVLTTIDGVKQILVWNKGTIGGITPEDGKVLWRYDWRTDRPIPNPLPVGDGKLFLTIGYGKGTSLIKVKKDGAEWKVEEIFQGDERTKSKVSSPVFYEGHIYSNAQDNNGASPVEGLQCLDADANVLWNTKGDPWFQHGAILIADGKILAMGGQDGVLRLVEASPKGYKELAKAKVLDGKELWAPMALSNGKLVVRSHKEMKCLEVGEAK